MWSARVDPQVDDGNGAVKKFESIWIILQLPSFLFNQSSFFEFCTTRYSFCPAIHQTIGNCSACTRFDTTHFDRVKESSKYFSISNQFIGDDTMNNSIDTRIDAQSRSISSSRTSQVSKWISKYVLHSRDKRQP